MHTKGKRLLIIGGGFMGCTLAKYFSEYVSVFLYEENPQRVHDLKKDMNLENVEIIEDLSENVHPLMVIEAIPEVLTLKQALFQRIEKIFHENITLCTNTSSFLVSDIAVGLEEKNRLLGTHFFSPAHISPLVEIIPSKWTDEYRVKEIMNFMSFCNKKPVHLKEEVPGFIANRLQSALAREAMSLVQKDIVTAEEVDFIAKWGIGIRLAMTGPLEQRDINGLDTHLSINEYVYPSLEDSHTPLKILQDKVENNHLGMKTGSGFYDWKSVDIDSYLEEKDKQLLGIMNIAKKEC